MGGSIIDMISLTDRQLKIVMPAAATLPIEKRSLFLQRLAAELERRGYYSSNP
jgi:hypothetical protein